ncbi:MAG: HlyC/CorC family transporter [Magnetococcales bacterium]|nr:HlyC/CorC family transporter [Magnetococcales bacterium]
METPLLFDPMLIIQLVLFVVLLGCSAFFSGSEVALFSLNQIQLDQMAKENHPRLDLIRTMLKDPRALITTILIGNELVNVAASNISATLLITFFGGEEKWWLNILVMLPILLLFGEITPKTIAVRNNSVVAGFVAPPLAVFRRLIGPLRTVVGWVSNLFITLLIGEQKGKQSTITEEMVRTLAEQASQDGAIDSTERIYIDNIFNFGNIRVKDVMVPRAKIFFLAKSASLDEIILACKQTGYTRIPVYDGHRDDLVGILHVRDLVKSISATGKATLNPMTLLRKPAIVSANRLVSSLFQSFKEKNHSLAMVVDEFGGIIGLITMHDLLEIIFGNLHVPPADGASGTTAPAANGCYVLEGVVPMDKFSQMVGSAFPEVDAETVGGMVLEILGELPELGQKITVSGWELTVLELENNRVAKVSVCQNRAKSVPDPVEQGTATTRESRSSPQEHPLDRATPSPQSPSTEESKL